MKKRGTNLIVCMLCAALAFTFTVQIRSVKRNNNLKGADQLRAEELQKSLTNETDKNRKLEQQLDQYKRDIDEMRRLMGEDGTISEAVLSQLQNAEVLAGTVAVVGPGVSVMMDDMGGMPAGSADPNQFVIHDSDILQVLNELRDAGAEALSINGQRVLANTEVRCAGNVLSINNERTSAPFEIRAIGDPQKLASGLLMRGGVADTFQQLGIEVKVTQLQQLEVPAYHGGLTFEYAKPSGGGDGS